MAVSRTQLDKHTPTYTLFKHLISRWKLPQLAIYLDTETARKLDEAASKEGVSRSAWARRAIDTQLESRFPESYFEILGTWEDDREPDEIIKEIRKSDRDVERPDLDR
jgi:predicted transcriptional regulator